MLTCMTRVRVKYTYVRGASNVQLCKLVKLGTSQSQGCSSQVYLGTSQSHIVMMISTCDTGKRAFYWEHFRLDPTLASYRAEDAAVKCGVR